VLSFVLGYAFYPYRPHFEFDKKKALHMWNFGKWLFVSTIIFFIVSQGDDIFVGRYLGTVLLGCYLMAYKIATLPASGIGRIVATVAFPAYSKLQNDLPRLLEAFLKVITFVACLTFLVAGIMLGLSRDFAVLFVSSEGWDMELFVPTLRVLVCLGIFKSLGATLSPLLNAMGVPNIATKFQIMRLVTLVVLIYPFTRMWSITGTALAVLVSLLPLQACVLVKIAKLTKTTVSKLIYPLMLPTLSAAIMLAVIYLCKHFWLTEITFASFTAIAIIGLFVYVSVCCSLDKFFRIGVINIFRAQFKVLLK
jgi:O-antigen/teichoic acid export membrane protein